MAEGLSNSQRRVLKKIRELGKVLSSDLASKTRLAPRTVNFAVRELLRRGLIKKCPNLADMRTVWYYPADNESTGAVGCNYADVLTSEEMVG